MRKLIVILFCLPLFVFSQKEKTYTRTMSVSQFAKELKDAADRGNGYTLENCQITYDPIRDKKYVIDNLNLKKYEGDAVIKDLHFSDSSTVLISNCEFGNRKELPDSYNTTFRFFNCRFWNISFVDIATFIVLDSTTVKNNLKFSLNKKEYPGAIKTSSKLTDNYGGAYLGIGISHSDIKNFVAVKKYYETDFSAGIDIVKSKIDCIRPWGFKNISIFKNRIKMILLGYQSYGLVEIGENIFEDKVGFGNVSYLNINDFNIWNLENRIGIFVHGSEIKTLRLWKNIIKPLKTNDINFDNLLMEPGGRIGSKPSLRITDSIKKLLIIDSVTYDHSTWNQKQKASFIQKIFDSNKIKLKYNPPKIDISESNIDELYCNSNTLEFLSIKDNQIANKLSIRSTILDSVFYFEGNMLPISNRISIDSCVFNRLGFRNADRDYYGMEEYENITKNYDGFLSGINNLVETYRLLINILDNKGSDLKSELVINLKNIQTNKSEFKYYEDPNINAWFNWKGAQFLKWYSDYGTNPFKALMYCFWTMLYFAIFYFFFYSDWDKIDRGFLIKRFNSVMDYFTTRDMY